MIHLAETCERIAGTTKKLEKTAIVAAYLRARELDDAAISAVFLAGGAFPAFEERTLQVGGSLLWRVAKDVSGASENDLHAGYRKTGDLGAAVYQVHPEDHYRRLADRPEGESSRRGNSQGLRRFPAGHSARQHAAR